MVRLKHGTAINPFAYTASKAAGGLISAATGDLAVIRTTTRPRGKKHAPVELELHFNPASIGVGLVGVGIALWTMQLRLHPRYEETTVTIEDEAGYYKTVHHDVVGHYVDETRVVGTQTQWIGPTIIKGTLKPGQWITTNKVEPTGNQVWVTDVTGWDEKVWVQPVTHTESSIVKKYVIEQRQGFGVEDIPIVGQTVSALNFWGGMYSAFTHPFGKYL